jgi:tRNA G46 methylase TrmB
MIMDILTSIKISEIYSNNLIQLNEISDRLNLSGNDIESEKYKYQEFKKLIKSSTLEIIDNSYDSNVYGEVSINGVYNLNNELEEVCGTFYDIGSGNGKLLLQMSLISNFDKYVGVEISKIRHLYALEINKSLSLDVIFINDDVLNVDLSDAGFVFINDIMFDNKLTKSIVDKIPVGCYFTSVYDNSHKFVKTIYLSVSWMSQEIPFNIYLKNI